MTSGYMFDRDILDGLPVETATTRPAVCPACQGRAIDTLAKVVTTGTRWRCRGCEHTWTHVATAAARYPGR